MIKKVSHETTGFGAADFAFALGVASQLHQPVTQEASRAPEVAPAPQLMGLRTTAARPHRRKVRLNRLAAMRG